MKLLTKPHRSDKCPHSKLRAYDITIHITPQWCADVTLLDQGGHLQTWGDGPHCWLDTETINHLNRAGIESLRESIDAMGIRVPS
jgi:hypothetical protein